MTQVSSNLQQVKENSASNDSEVQKTLSQKLRFQASRVSSNWVLCVLLGGTAMGFNLYRLGVPSIWFDEAFSVELARQPLPLLWHIIFGPEPNMELYYLFLHGWLGVTAFFGLHATEFVVRLPSAIFAALSTVVVFLLGRRFLGLPAGIVGACLYLLNDLQLVYSQQTRSYSLQLLLICIAWYAFLAALMEESRQKRWWMCFIAAITLAVYAQLFTLFILLAQALTFGFLLILPGPWRNKTRRQWLAGIMSLVIISGLIAPLLKISSHGSKGSGWLPVPHRGDIIHLFHTITAGNRFYLYMIIACCLFGLFVAMLVYLPSGTSLLELIALNSDADGNKKRMAELQQFLPVGLALVFWLIVPIVVSYIISQGSTRVFSPRYLVTIVPPLMLLVGMGVAGLRWYRIQVVLALLLFLLALYVVPLYYKSAQVEDWNKVSFWLEHHYQVGDGLVCYDNIQGCQISVEYYLHAYPSAAHFTADTPGAYSWVAFNAPHATAAVDPQALSIFGAKHPRIFFIVGRLSGNTGVARAKAAQSWLDNHYHFIAQIVTRTVTVRLYTTDRIEMTRFIAPQEVFHDSGER